VASSRTPSEPRHVGLIVDPLAREDGQAEPEYYRESTPQAAEALGLDLPAAPQDSGTTNETCSLPLPAADTDAEPPLAPLGAPLNGSPGPHPPAVVSASADGSGAERASNGAPPTPSRSGAAAASDHPVRRRLLEKAAEARSAHSPHASAAGLDELEHEPHGQRLPRDAELDRVAAGEVRSARAPLLLRGKAQLTPNLIALFGTLLGLATVATIVALAIHLDPNAHPEPEPTASASAAAINSAAPSRPRVKRAPRQRVRGPWRIRDAKDEPGVRTVSGEVGRIPFLKAVQDAGVPKKQAYRVLIAMKGLHDFDKCNRSDRFVAMLNRSSSRLVAFEYIVSKEEVYQAREGKNGLLTGKRLDLKVERGQVSGALAMNTNSLSEAAAAAGFDKGLVSALRKALNGHMTVEEIERGDRLRIIAQEITVLGEFSRYAGIEALEYLPGSKSNKPLRIYYFRSSGSPGHYDARGRAPYEGGWRKPIPGAPVTSPFNLKRMHPVLKKVMPHYGTDFGAAAGTPVGASSFGTVSFVGYSGAAGNLVKIEHPGGIETGYAHLQRFAEGLKTGDKVKRLQVLGYVGSTGRSTGPHLHFSAKKDGKFFDAQSLKLDAMRVLPQAEREAFAHTKAKYDKLLDAIELPAVSAAPVAAAASTTPGEAAVGEAMGEEELEGESAVATPSSAAAKPPGAAATSAVYLSDKELLEMQAATDDGEVTY
jgi:murein DD-endopeptidase MepM/ murein hydrolase activator NlpD